MIKVEHIQLIDKVVDWKEAIRISAKPLLDDNIVNQNYINQMISNVQEMGAYIVITKDIALPHARPEDGANTTGISILKLKNRVAFSEDKKVNIIITLASSNNGDHITNLKFISKILSDKDNYKRLLDAISINQIVSIFNEQDQSDN